MGFQSLWLEDAEAPYAYFQGVGIGEAQGQMSLNQTLGALTVASNANVQTPGSMSLAATLGLLTCAAVLQPSVIVYKAVWDLVNSGLNVFIQRERSSVIPYDYVISWDPPIGTALPPYSEVTLTVSDGPVNSPAPGSAIPNVTGLTSSAAVQLLYAGGWSPGQYTWAVDSSDAGTVIAQSPASGTIALPGTVVTLTISLGPTSTQADVIVQT